MNARHGWRAIDIDNAILLPVGGGMQINPRTPAKPGGGVLPLDLAKYSLGDALA
jgi:hypothetical protein